MLARVLRRRSLSLTRRLPVLQVRDFRILLMDRVLAPASVAFSMVGVSFAVLDHTHGSTAKLSYVLAAQIAPSLIFALVGGVIADRIAPQLVIIGGNVMMAVGEGTFGVLVLAGHPQLWQMIALECVTGTGVAVFYPASSALLPRVVPGDLLQEASAVSRLAMNAAMMGGAVVAGFVVAATGPGWALVMCGTGLLGTVPVLLALRVTAGERASVPGLYRELADGWSEVRSRTWLWVVIVQFTVVMMAWYGGFSVLGPVIARTHLGGPAAWGTITGAESLGLIVGGLVALRFSPRRPMLFIVFTGASFAVAPLALGMLWPVPLICAAALVLGVGTEIMMVQWTIALARNIPPDKLARVSSYDVLGTVMAMPVGAVLAGPIAAWAGVSATEYGAVALILTASALALLPRDIRKLRAEQLADPSLTAASKAGAPAAIGAAAS
jgi:MFS family permease